MTTADDSPRETCMAPEPSNVTASAAGGPRSRRCLVFVALVVLVATVGTIVWTPTPRDSQPSPSNPSVAGEPGTAAAAGITLTATMDLTVTPTATLVGTPSSTPTSTPLPTASPTPTDVASVSTPTRTDVASVFTSTPTGSDSVETTGTIDDATTLDDTTEDTADAGTGSVSSVPETDDDPMSNTTVDANGSTPLFDDVATSDTETVTGSTATLVEAPVGTGDAITDTVASLNESTVYSTVTDAATIDTGTVTEATGLEYTAESALGTTSATVSGSTDTSLLGDDAAGAVETVDSAAGWGVTSRLTAPLSNAAPRLLSGIDRGSPAATTGALALLAGVAAVLVKLSGVRIGVAPDVLHRLAVVATIVGRTAAGQIAAAVETIRTAIATLHTRVWAQTGGLIIPLGVVAGSSASATSNGLVAATGRALHRGLTAARSHVASRIPRLGPIPGYSQYDDSDPLENAARQDVFERVRESPGIYRSEVAAETGLAPTTVRYHARILAEESLLTEVRINGRQRLFPIGTGDDDRELAAALDDDSTASVLAGLEVHEPVGTAALADQLDLCPSTVSYHLSRLEERDLVVRERQGRAVVTRLAPDVRDALATSEYA